MDDRQDRARGGSSQEVGYRSAGHYLSQNTAWSQSEMGSRLPDPIARAIKDGNRACARGLGPGTKSLWATTRATSKTARISQAVGGWWASVPPQCHGGGAWFIAHDVELSTTRACLVSMTEGACPAVSWCLPARNTDFRTEGVDITHYCECVGTASKGCHVCSMRCHLELLAAGVPAQDDRWEVSRRLPAVSERQGEALLQRSHGGYLRGGCQVSGGAHFFC